MKFLGKLEEKCLNLLVYNKQLYRWIEENASPSARDVVDILIRHFHPSSIIDAGCGTWVYL